MQDSMGLISTAKAAIMIIEQHRTHRLSWLRAAVLGANDGILSTSSLIVGVAAAHSTQSNILISGTAGLVAGAMAMAAGEYVSVSTQEDAENADLKREREEILLNPELEMIELAKIYVDRGLNIALAQQVAKELMAHDPLKAHARDELGITETGKARPVLAGLTSGCSFAVGAALPLCLVLIFPVGKLISAVFIGSIVFLAGLGIAAARLGGAGILKSVARITFWGALAMGVTAGIGGMFGK